MFQYASQAPTSQRVRNAQFLHGELPIRIAQRALELGRMPEGLASTMPVRDVCGVYNQYVRQFEECPVPKDEETERAFTNMLKGMVLERSDIPQRINAGLLSLSDSRRTPLSRASVRSLDDALYSFFLSRVGLRFLTEHHVACEGGGKGLIEARTDPIRVCKEVAAHVKDHFESEVGWCPPVNVRMPSKRAVRRETMTYVPTHLKYMLTELLMNSCRATVESNPGGGSDDLAIDIMVSIGHEDVAVKISDRGGGSQGRGCRRSGRLPARR